MVMGMLPRALRPHARLSSLFGDRIDSFINAVRRGQDRMPRKYLGAVVAGLPPKIDLPCEHGRLLPSTKTLRDWANGLDGADRRKRYPWLAQFSRNIGLSEDTLIASYELEDKFHDLILSETAIDVRRQLNDEVYTKAFELYGVTFKFDFDAVSSPKDAIVDLLRDELMGKSILDIGCGGGDFLLSCHRNIRHGALLGLDVFVKDTTITDRDLGFRRSDVVRFNVTDPFDIAITDNVYEHIAPQDIGVHLDSIYRALKPGGRVIILTPHRAFGPWDVTRIVDNSNTGWIPARGTHINETTYGELSAALHASGFENLKAVHPKARLGLKVARSRVPVDHLCRGEQRPVLMRFLQSMDKRYRYQAFEICIIGTRPL
jgi:SAM-dependent methyltransferase